MPSPAFPLCKFNLHSFRFFRFVYTPKGNIVVVGNIHPQTGLPLEDPPLIPAHVLYHNSHNPTSGGHARVLMTCLCNRIQWPRWFIQPMVDSNHSRGLGEEMEPLALIFRVAYRLPACFAYPISASEETVGYYHKGERHRTESLGTILWYTIPHDA